MGRSELVASIATSFFLFLSLFSIFSLVHSPPFVLLRLARAEGTAKFANLH